MKKLAIIIPVYNEEESIEKVLNDWKRILQKKFFDIIIINDGSTDNTKLILSKIKKKNSHIEIINKPNGGHGESVFYGYKYAIKKKYKFIFQVDSDDQFSASDFKKIWRLRNKTHDLIIGNREKRKDSFIRVFLSKFILKQFFLFYFKKNLIDANVPYRLMKYEFLKKFMKKSSKKYIAPNILMSLFAKNICVLRVKHYQRSKGVISWSFKRLFYFGVRLILDLLEWKKITS
jgi:glycosyltransferase involved in cell wall biosynthesis